MTDVHLTDGAEAAGCGGRNQERPFPFLLVGPATFSAAEDFVVAFAQMGRGIVVGKPTAGNTGQPLSFPLPGGGSARVRTKHDRFADGTEFIGVGIRPSVVVHPTLAGIRAGRDEALDAAVRALAGDDVDRRSVAPPG